MQQSTLLSCDFLGSNAAYRRTKFLVYQEHTICDGMSEENPMISTKAYVIIINNNSISGVSFFLH